MTHQNFIGSTQSAANKAGAYTPAAIAPSVSTSRSSTPAAPSFNDVLSRQINSRQLQFSKHAAARLCERKIELTRDQLNRVEDGLTRARTKGINDTLVLVDDVALVVNVRNNIVVTAMSRQVENTFTNIDGAVVV